MKKEVTYNWSENEDKAFNRVKSMITQAPTLIFYDPKKELTVENDACEYGIGSALLQEGRPVAYASRTLSAAERRYANIEREMLAAVYGLEKFHHYTYGRHTTVVSDHKPLEAISKKPLASAPRRLQSLLLRAKTYKHTIVYKAGKDIPLADALSRAPVDRPREEEVTAVHAVTFSKIKPSRLEDVRKATAGDNTLMELGKTILVGWPDTRSETPEVLLPYFGYRDELTIQDGVLYRGDRVIIPDSLRREMKTKVHAGHLGINACLRRARDMIFWPGMSAEIRHHVETCGTCATYCDKQPTAPLVMQEVPTLPWQKISTALFTWEGKEHLVTVDHNSGFFEVDILPNISSETVIAAMKPHFARHGIPEGVTSDNGAQYTSASFKKFSSEWRFTHETISPGNSQANGIAEAAVKVAKKIL